MFFQVSSVIRTTSNSYSLLRSSYRMVQNDSIQEWFRLMKNNKEWAADTKAKDPNYFIELSKAQVSSFYINKKYLIYSRTY